ncbi:MAG TPA: phosphomannomutase/phosphoglucomutase [Armatimonadota bacterium]|nr:phosphomannomutase/phosphoglucomutase [Armatimonadota bacterium]
MNVDPKIFKAYDIRGTVPDQLNEEIAYKIGRAFVRVVKAQRVVVGHDMRVSGPMLYDALTRGITDEGADVLTIDRCATDIYYYACATTNAAGVMITASHNPKQYNGFKMVREMPYLLSGDEGIQDIRHLVEANQFGAPTHRGEIKSLDVREGFVNKILSLIDVKELKPLKVVIDAGNGMGGVMADLVYEKLPIEVVRLYFEPDGTFPNHGGDPLIAANRAELEKRVVSEGAHCGFAFDGDADRFFSVDDRGQFVPGDFMTALLAREILKKQPGSKIIYDLRASHAVPDIIRENGGTPLMNRVGHAYIKRRMKDEDAVFAGEVTGHYYFRDFFCADSGLIPSLRVLEMLSRHNCKLSDLLKPLEEHYFISGEINVPLESDAEKTAKLTHLEEKYGDAKLLHMDGLSVEYPDWHFNVRPSNTEPLLRLNLEARTPEMMCQKRDEVLAIIKG